MNTLINSIGGIFNLAGRIFREEARGARNTLLYILVAFYTLCLFQWILDGNWFVRTLGYAFCLAGTLLIFKVPSMMRLVGLGELLETLRVTETTPNAEENCVPGILDNQLSSSAWNVMEAIFLFFSICCLVIPNFPIRNHPEIIPVFTITAAMIYVLIWRKKSRWLRPAAWTTALIFLAVHIALAFPGLTSRVNYYTGWENVIGKIIPADVAGISNNTDKLRAQQISDKLKNLAQRKLDWQEKNPGEYPPEDFKIEEDAIKAGMTLNEYKVQIAPREVAVKFIEEYLAADSKRKVTDLNAYCQKVWSEHQSKLSAEKAAAQQVIATVQPQVQVAAQPPPQAEVVKPESRFIGRWTLHWEGNGNSVTSPVEVAEIGEKITMFQGETTYSGIKIGDLSYKGEWKTFSPEYRRGRFSIKFDSDNPYVANGQVGIGGEDKFAELKLSRQ